VGSVFSGGRESLEYRAFPRDQRRKEKKAPMKKALYGFSQLQQQGNVLNAYR
jgi:hypothetical protein